VGRALTGMPAHVYGGGLGDTSFMSEESMTLDRWFIVEYRTGTRAGSQAMDGFATKDEAEAWHRDLMGGDMRYVFRYEAIDPARVAAERLARERR